MRTPVALLLLCPVLLSAQESRLNRLDSATEAEVRGIIESAAARGLPTEPLVQKALEGAAKRADPQRIGQAVRALSERLETARAAFGGTGTTEELVAGASALYVGIPPAALQRVKALRGDGPLAMPLLALTFFVQRGVAREASIDLIESLMSARVNELDLQRLQEAIDLDIRSGAVPLTATHARVQSLLRTRR